MPEITQSRYEMEDVECKFCTEYKGKKRGCVHKVCPWLEERIKAGAVGYEEALLKSFSRNPRLEGRLDTAIRLFHGSLWLDEAHHQRMEALKIREKFNRRRDTPAYFAAMYLLTADQDIYQRTANCFCRSGIEFSCATTRGISPHGYTLLGAARDIYANGENIALDDLADGDIIDAEAFCLIINALLIVRCGCAVLEIQKKQACDS